MAKNKRKQMTMKQRLFYSNLLMVILPIISIVVILGIFILFARNFILTDWKHLEKSTASFTEIQQFVESTPLSEIGNDQSSINYFLDECGRLGYEVSVFLDGTEWFGNMDEEELSYFSDYLKSEINPAPGQALWIQQFFTNILIEKINSDDLILTVVAESTDEWLLGKVTPLSLLEILAVGCLMVAAIIMAVILISLFLARRIINKITLPLDALCEGAERVSSGNLEQDIPCDGTVEMGKVCHSFNEMQHQLRANLEKNRRYEQAKNEMLAGISHDLRTPLTSIKSYVKGVLDGVARTPEKQENYLKVAYRKAGEMEGLIEQLFLLSKLETESFPFRFEEYPIRSYLEKWLESVELEISKNNATVDFESNCTRETVLLDAEQMRRVFNNIVSNSLKYNKERNLHITVQLFREESHVKILFQDDGIGVSDAQAERMFDSFYRGDESRTNPTEGSGLGLSIAKRIVTAHHGTIGVKNYNGLTIIITLPIESEDNQ